MIVLSLFDSTGTWGAFAPPEAEVYAVDLSPNPQASARERQLRGEHIDSIAADVCVLPDWLLARWASAKPRDRVLLTAPPCQAIGNMRHVRLSGGGVASMTTEQGLEFVRFCAAFAARWMPRIWCLENPAVSLAWSVVPREQVVRLGWFGFPAQKPTGLGGRFNKVRTPFPLPTVDPTDGGKRPCALRPGVGGVQAMPSYLRARTPPDFARAWWAAQEE